MDQAEYGKMVKALAKPGAEILKELTAEDAHKIHMIMGISGEAGELLDAIKKETVYRKAPDRANVVEELGDLEFYMEGLRQAYDITRDETLESNHSKLSVRYEAGSYSDKAAQDRADKQ